MILISQDGRVIERLTEVHINGTEPKVHIESPNYYLATYSTEEKALKALERLINEITHHCDRYVAPDLSPSAESYFIFPKESDVD